jgi:hypothetical protein
VIALAWLFVLLATLQKSEGSAELARLWLVYLSAIFLGALLYRGLALRSGAVFYLPERALPRGVAAEDVVELVGERASA